jgi:tetratricopeptide (TPR) repeat protein
MDTRRTEGSRTAILQLVHRETILLVALSAVAIAGYFATRTVAAANRRVHLADAARWYAAGESNVRAGDPHRAASAFRRAIALDPSRREYRLALADALSASHDDDAARFVLQQLQQLDPEDEKRTTDLEARHAAGAADASSASSLDTLGRIVDEIVSRDPLTRGLASATRRQRVQSLLDDLHLDLAACGDAAAARDAESAASNAHRTRSRSIDTVEAEVGAAARISSRASEACRNRPLPRAVVLIARRHGIATE